MPQVNGFQNPGLAFVRPAGGLTGFQRQGMDQRKKDAAPPAVFLGGNKGTNNGSGQFPVSAATLAGIGAIEGDQIVIDAYWPSASGIGLVLTGWTTTGGITYPVGNNSMTLLWRRLTAADIAGGILLTGMTTTPSEVSLGWGVYRNAPVVALISSAYSQSVTTLTVPAAALSAQCAGLLLVSGDRNQAPGRTFPPLWNVRIQFNGLAGAFGDDGRADLLDLSKYSPTASLPLTGLDASNEHGGFLLELRAA